MKYKLTITVEARQWDDEKAKYIKIDGQQSFICPNESYMSSLISSMAGAIEDGLTITIEKIREEEPNE